MYSLPAEIRSNIYQLALDNIKNTPKMEEIFLAIPENLFAICFTEKLALANGRIKLNGFRAHHQVSKEDNYYGNKYKPEAALFNALLLEGEKFVQIAKDILEFQPDSVKYNQGKLRLFGECTPLLLTILNEKMPLEIIKSILEKGGSPNEKAHNNTTNTIVQYVNEAIEEDRGQEYYQRVFRDEERAQKIISLLGQYGNNMEVKK